MATWPVFVEEWQFSCCGDLFAIGDEVAWILLFAPAPPPTTPPEMVVTAPVHVEGPAEGGQIVRLAEHLVAGVRDELPVSGEAISGALIEEHHGAGPLDVPPTRGIVRRIRVVTREYRLGEKAWEPASADADYEDVPCTPDRFADERDEARGTRRRQTGMLVDLEVA